MKKIFIKFILSVLLVGFVYTSFNYTTPQTLKIQNEVNYYINHMTDIGYIINYTLSNAKNLTKYIQSGGGVN